MNDNVPHCDRAHTLELLIRTALDGATEAERTAAAAELMKAGVFTYPPPDDNAGTHMLTRA